MPQGAGMAQGHMGAEQCCCLSLRRQVGSGEPAWCQLDLRRKKQLHPLPAAAFKPSQTTTPMTVKQLRWSELPRAALPRVSPGCPAGRRQRPRAGGAMPVPTPGVQGSGLGHSHLWDIAIAGCHRVGRGEARCHPRQWDVAGSSVTWCHRRQQEAAQPEVISCHCLKRWGNVKSSFGFHLPETKAWLDGSPGAPGRPW